MTLIWLSLTSTFAFAGDFPRMEWMAGFEGNERTGYAFTSVTSPSFAERATPVARMSVSHLYYVFRDEAGETQVVSPGYGFSVGIRWRPSRFSLTALVGFEGRFTTEHASTSSITARSDLGGSTSLDAYFQANTRLALAIGAYYGFVHEYVWARALAKHQIVPLEGSAIAKLSLGVDATLHGNALVRGADGGLLAELAIPGIETAVGLRAGLGREIQPGGSPAPIVSVGASVYTTF